MLTSSTRLEALQARHIALTQKIEREQTRPGANDWIIRALKRQKLHIKEQIEGIA